MRVNILGYMVNTFTVLECVENVFHLLTEEDRNNKRPGWLACLNPHSYVVALNDMQFSEALNDSDWLVADGIGVVVAAKFLGEPIPERVTGSDVFFGLNERMNQKGGMSVFFLGSTEETLVKIHEQISKDYPNIAVVGTYSPPFNKIFSSDEVDTMIGAINSASPDVLWVGMTAPKQEKWIFHNLHRLDVKFAGAIGAVFDFYTERIKRPGPFFQRYGLEWLPRLIQQPKRLWRRIVISGPLFIWHVIRYRLGMK